MVPEADSQRALARALGIPPRELELRPWPRWLPAHGGMPDGLPWTAGGSLDALTALVDDGGSDPRGFPITDGTGLRDAIADWDAAVSQAAPAADADTAAGARTSAVRPPGAPAPGRPETSRGRAAGRVPAQSAGPAWERGNSPEVVDGPVVAWLEAGVLGLRQLDDRLGGGAVRQRVEADLRLVHGLLTRGTQPPATRARLLGVAADLAQLGGWAATDTGRHSAAQRHYLTGLRLAHTAGDRGMAVSLWSGLALHAVIAGRPQDAVAAAEAAVRAAGGTRWYGRWPPAGWPGRRPPSAPTGASGGPRLRQNAASKRPAGTRHRSGCTGSTAPNSPPRTGSRCSTSGSPQRPGHCWSGRWRHSLRPSCGTAASMPHGPPRPGR